MTQNLPGDVAERFFALGFALDQMNGNLRDLERIVGEWSKPATDTAHSRASRNPGGRL